MLLKLDWILIMFGGKYYQENVKNGISEHLDFEIVWGSMPQTPVKARPLRASQLPWWSETSGYGTGLLIGQFGERNIAREVIRDVPQLYFYFKHTFTVVRLQTYESDWLAIVISIRW